MVCHFCHDEKRHCNKNSTISLGNCISSLVSWEEGCPFNSFAFACSEEERKALSCICDEGIQSPLCLGNWRLFLSGIIVDA